MEIVGKVIQILDIQRGTSARTGKDWALKTFILETQEQYPRKVAIEIFGEDRINQNPVAIDQLVTASVDIESREVNGRWYTSARLWKVAQGDTTQAAAPAPAAAPAAPAAAPMAPSVETFDATPGGEGTDLPF